MSEQHVSPEQLVDYLHGELPASEDAAVRAHLAACAECREAYDAEARLTELMRGHARAQERELPQGVVASIHEAIAASQAPWWQRFTASLRPLAIGTAIAAGILVGTFASLRTWHTPAQASTIDAAYYLDDHAALAPTTPFGESCALPTALNDGNVASDERPVDR